jgi:hypothetical protein
MALVQKQGSRGKEFGIVYSFRESRAGNQLRLRRGKSVKTSVSARGGPTAHSSAAAGDSI